MNKAETAIIRDTIRKLKGEYWEGVRRQNDAMAASEEREKTGTTEDPSIDSQSPE